MKLISMTDFVLEQVAETPRAVNFGSYTEIADYKRHAYERITQYAVFLKQPLKLEMFVPCDNEGNVLEIPNIDKVTPKFDIRTDFSDYFDKYQQAKEKVLFEGYKLGTSSMMSGVFAISNDLSDVIHFDLDDTIETMLGHISNLQLTGSALKQIGLCQ